ncbi:MAG TPA: MraY family glycosyltransferase [Bacilli bacterium]
MLVLYILGFVLSLILSVCLTPFIKQFAVWVKAVDKPNERKVHTRIMPRLGGLAIFAAFAGGFIVVTPVLDAIKAEAAWGLLIGGAVIALTGALDDRFDISPKWKLLGIILAACVVVAFGLKVNLVNVPFGHTTLNLDWLSIPLTIFWIVGVTNAINLIDGLDGLAAGVSAISTATILVLAALMGNITVILLCSILLGSIIGFLFFNFHPAKIFMGDTGALFLGFSIATLSILGFKQATLVSFIVPVLISGVPIYDTLFAIIRRRLNKKPIFKADKGHLHHCLLKLGLSHRQTVLVIYGVSIVFGLFAVALSQASQWIAVALTLIILVVLEVGAEAISMFGKRRKPLLNLFHRMVTTPQSRTRFK